MVLPDIIEYTVAVLPSCFPGATNYFPQVTQFLQAAKEDAVGTYAIGAFEGVMSASEEARKIINASSSM